FTWLPRIAKFDHDRAVGGEHLTRNRSKRCKPCLVLVTFEIAVALLVVERERRRRKDELYLPAILLGHRRIEELLCAPTQHQASFRPISYPQAAVGSAVGSA